MELVRIHLGYGALTWDRDERVSDRYGHVYLEDSNSLGEKITKEIPAKQIPRETDLRGRLIAVVDEPRQSTHIGDLTHGFHPTLPVKGEEIILSEVGTFAVERNYENKPAFVIIPDNKRKWFWLDPKMLYRAHEQTVNLYLEVHSKWVQMCRL